MTLRPEGTAPVVRAFIEHGLSSEPLPLKLYYFGQMFRYERPQAGRYREFYQIGVEAIGSPDPLIDAENIILLQHVLTELGAGELELCVNSMGCKVCRPLFLAALKEDLEGRLKGLCDDCKTRALTNPLRVFDCKNEACIEGLKSAPTIEGYLCQDCSGHFAAVRAALDGASLSYMVDPSLVRGFDYYTKTTFEIRSPLLGAQSALGGGGRYDGLVEELGGPPTPAIGFAIGTERLMMAIEASYGGKAEPFKIDAFVISTEAAREEAFKLLNDLRRGGLKADMDFGGRSFKGQMKHAGKIGVPFVVILGEDELKEGKALIKDMDGGEQVALALSEAAGFIKDNLKSDKEA